MKINKLNKKQNIISTLHDCIQWAVNGFTQAGLHYGHGTDNAWDEAVYLSLYALHLPPDADSALLSKQLSEQERQAIIELIQRRITERIPAAYLTHEAWFAGLPYYVDERVLVPRSPMAELIENEFSPWIDGSQIKRVLDLCTGSGCIAIATALQLPNVHVDATDISGAALEVAGINVEKHHVEDLVHLIHSDLFSAIQEQRYDLIISNPPYVSEEELQTLPREYTHEPRLGFAASDEGLAIVIKILKQAANYLTPQGVLIVEVGNSQYALQERFPRVPFTWLEFERGEDGVFLLTAEQLKLQRFD
jgi:ribosomal protein L3 glutamine methyltransferase